MKKSTMISPNTILLQVLRTSVILQGLSLTRSAVRGASHHPLQQYQRHHPVRRRSKISPASEIERNVAAFGNNPYDDHFIWLWDHNHLSYYQTPSEGEEATADGNSVPSADGMNNDNTSSSSSSSQTDPAPPEYSNSNRNNSAESNGPVILIVQDASPGPDEEVLYVTSKVNRAYAKRWGFDYLHFTGIAVGGSYSWQATFNKPYLLQKLIHARIENSKPKNRACSLEELQKMQKRDISDAGTEMNASNSNTTSISCIQNPSVPSYDIVMFLDSNAIIVQLDFNVISLIQSDKMISTSTSKIIDINNNNNADVVLWNLNHPQTAHVSNQWIKQCYLNSSTLKNLIYKSQSEIILSKILQSDNMDNIDDQNNNSNNNSNINNDNNNTNAMNTVDIIQIIPSPMVDGLQGTLVKQDMSYNDYLIDVSDLRKIMPIVTGIADSVCYRFYPQCEIV